MNRQFIVRIESNGFVEVIDESSYIVLSCRLEKLEHAKVVLAEIGKLSFALVIEEKFDPDKVTA